MFWDFWKKRSDKEESPQTKVEKLSKPQNLPQAVRRDIISHLRKDPDWVWHLKSVVRLRNKKKRQYDVRVFDEAQASARGVNVENYNSLNEHPELILFEGWYDRRSWKAHIEEKGKPEPVPKAA